jgi:hypothetical protein
MDEKPKYDGELVRIGDRDFVVPALSVKQARNLWPEILEMDQGITKVNLPDKQSKMIEIIHAAISRNYPNITKDEIEDLIDLRSIRKLMMVVMGNSELPMVPPVEPAAETTRVQ